MSARHGPSSSRPASASDRPRRAYRGQSSLLQKRGLPAIFMPGANPCSRCRRLRSSGTLVGILRALETLRVYRSLAGSAAATGSGDALDIPVSPDACVAAAAGCDRAARSWGSCGRWRPCGSIAASRARQRLQGWGISLYSGQARCLCSRCRRLRSSGTLAGILRALETLRVYRSLAGSAAATGMGDILDIPVSPDACVAAAAGCDRAARSRGSCGRWRPCGSIAASRARQRLQGAVTPSIFRSAPMLV
ncbi:hypothetical protein C4K25_3931 [Pseudomonas chlororaphis]|nr:hypothetical protein C4K25_3931 [Pseudomonas chlororaphis]